MAALTHLCDFPSIPGFKFQPTDDSSIEKDNCKYYSCWDGKVLFISLISHGVGWKNTEDNINLKNKYQEAILKHNNSLENNEYPDAGFDVFVPGAPRWSTDPFEVHKIDFKIKCAMFNKLSYVECSVKDDTIINYKLNQPLGFYMYPRSSISKTHLRLANNVGIIDSGYRGNLGGVFDIHNLPADKAPYEQYQRLVQICSNTLEPFKVILVDDIDKLGTTERGEGGFGSTGV